MSEKASIRGAMDASIAKHQTSSPEDQEEGLG